MPLVASMILSETKATGSRVQSRVQTVAKRHRSYKPACVLLVLLTTFVVLQCFLPLGTTIKIGADEDFELCKAMLALKGHHFYTETWNDQPLLHTVLITQVVKHLSPSAPC